MFKAGTQGCFSFWSGGSRNHSSVLSKFVVFETLHSTNKVSQIHKSNIQWKIFRRMVQVFRPWVISELHVEPLSFSHSELIHFIQSHSFLIPTDSTNIQCDVMAWLWITENELGRHLMSFWLFSIGRVVQFSRLQIESGRLQDADLPKY